MKRKLSTKLVMLFITFFSATLIVFVARKSPEDTKKTMGIYSDTLYNTASKGSFFDSVFALDKSNETSEHTDSTLNDDTNENGVIVSVNDTSSEYTNANEDSIAGFDSSAEYTNSSFEADTNKSESYSGITTVSVYNHKTATISDMALEDYVACVISAEMPADSPPEALKAQAVAARTLAVNYILDGDKDEHMGADICTDSGHCQSFVSKEDFAAKYGNSGISAFTNSENAAMATRGLILLYDSSPILAVFHASSGGSTASGKEVWGGNLAYLRAVETSEIYDEELRDKVIDRVTFTRQEFLKRLDTLDIPKLPEYKDSPFPLWIGGKELSESGRVQKLDIAETSFSGTQIRKIFGLKSADFEISFEDDTVTFITRGYGHGVGMSQLGAVAMAKNGESFYAILSKYYPGTIIGII